MVAPSCCLEYRPTIYFWLIIFFIVFPCLYITGRVITCVIGIILRIICTIVTFLFWEPEEGDDTKLLKHHENEKARQARKLERRLEKNNLNVVTKQIKASSTQTDNSISFQMNFTKKTQPSDNSDSLISDDEISQTTTGTNAPEIYNATILPHHTKSRKII